MVFDDTVITSSSMDFVSEYGFKTDDNAKKLYQKSMGLL